MAQPAAHRAELAHGRVDLVGLGGEHLAIDARDYPIDALLGDPERTVVPRRHAGVTIDFAPVSFNSTTVVLESGSHATPPAGTLVQVAGVASPMVMGHDGQLFVVDAGHPQSVALNISGRRCVARVEAANTSEPELGSLRPMQKHSSPAASCGRIFWRISSSP